MKNTQQGRREFGPLGFNRVKICSLLIVVTHNVNINGLVSTHTEEGDIVVVERATGGALRVLGTIRAQ